MKFPAKPKFFEKTSSGAYLHNAAGLGRDIPSANFRM